MFRNTHIIGTGSYLPPLVVDNETLVVAVGMKSASWIEKRTGVRQRRFLSPIDPKTGRASHPVDELEMAKKAAQAAIENAGLASRDIMALIYVSCTQRPNVHLHFSRAAIDLHSRLGLPADTPALEIDAGCGGVMEAVGIADGMLRANDYQNILIVASNAPSYYIDRDLYVKEGSWLSIYIFGDGAGAAVLEYNPQKNQGILGTFWGVDAQHELMYYRPSNGGVPVYEIAAKEVKEQFPQYMHRALEGLRRKCFFRMEEIKRFYFHQANLRILENFAHEMGIPQEKLAVHVDRYANLSAAATLVLLDEDRREGRVHEGDLCLFAAVGAGTQYGAFLYRV